MIALCMWPAAVSMSGCAGGAAGSIEDSAFPPSRGWSHGARPLPAACTTLPASELGGKWAPIPWVHAQQPQDSRTQCEAPATPRVAQPNSKFLNIILLTPSCHQFPLRAGPAGGADRCAGGGGAGAAVHQEPRLVHRQDQRHQGGRGWAGRRGARSHKGGTSVVLCRVAVGGWLRSGC